MIVEVHYVGDEFIAYDSDGNRITNRNILEQIAFAPFTGTITTRYIEVDNITNDAIIQPLDVNININTQKR